MTITRDLYAARNIDFAPVLELDYSGGALPLSGANISIQVRLYAGAPTLLAGSTAVFSDAAHATDPALRTLTVEPKIAKAVLDALPSGLNKPEVGEADRFDHEIKLTYADGAQDILWAGGFFLEPGVNRS